MIKTIRLPLINLLLLLLLPAAQTISQPQPPFANLPMINEGELKEMFDYLSTLSPDELEELNQIGRNMLTQMGINPDTLEPMATAPTPEAQPTPTAPALPAPPEPTVSYSPYTKEKVQETLDKLIERLQRIRQKNSSSESISLTRELDQLIRYLHIINKKRHHERLLEVDFAPLIKALQQLADTLDIYEPLFVIDTFIVESPIDNPYDLLGVSLDATPEQLEAAFARLQTTKNPEAIKRELEPLGIQGAELEQAIKEAQLSFNIITDAYEILKDKKSKQQIDRELQAQLAQHREAAKGSIKALQYIQEALKRAFEEAKIINA
ncbi:MAG TPA: hypothetical protein VHA52_12340, partial [Candidatus Babeliaceae bacterium]|nr:hypothetical protein [Candidatus Babeliaceae bacterium]